MKNLIVYGSLLNKKELLNENISISKVELVKVYGYKRVFTQEPSYRLLKSINRAVLNIQEEKNIWFNALVIKNLSKEYLEKLDIRESGYEKIYLDEKQVISYNNEFISDCIVYKGKKQKQSSEIFPNNNYFDICLEGAKSFGEEFLNDFLKSTYKNSKNGLVLI